MKIKVTTTIIFFGLTSFIHPSEKFNQRINFSADYLNKQDSFSIHFVVKNISDSMLYFHIGAEGIVKSKWISLLGDLNALGEMDFAFPKPLKPGTIYTTRVSLKKIREEFEGETGNIDKVRFIIYYYKKQNFFSPYEYLYSREFNMPIKKGNK